MIRVRFAVPADRDRLVDFIGEHWSASHIFTHRPDVLSWQHEDADGRLNMVLAEEVESSDDPETGSIEAGPVLALLGFIPMGRFDAALADRDVMLAIWKVRESDVPPGVGLRLLKFLRRELDPRLIAAVGTSQTVRPIYEVLGYTTGALRHVALFHPDTNRSLVVASGFPVARVSDVVAPTAAVTLVPVDETNPAGVAASIDRLGNTQVPAKSWAYVCERYLRHPWYRYLVRLVVVDGTATAVVVWRQVDVEGASVLRIVDVIGDSSWFASAQSVLEAAVVEAEAEYIDLLHLGADELALRAGGFVAPADFPGSVLPNYFSPFERRNVEIELAYKRFDTSDDAAGGARVQLFRADSDQDRPNLPADLEHTR